MKRWLQRHLPDPRTLLEHQALRPVAPLLREPRLWVFNRRSVSGAFALGFFILYLPPLGQPLYAALGAIKLRVNLPIAFSLVWLSNPLTIPPMFYFAYVVGCTLLLQPVAPFEIQFWLDWHHWLDMLAPILLGSLVCASLGALLAYTTVQALWRWHLLKRLRARRRARYGATNRPSSNRQIRSAQAASSGS